MTELKAPVKNVLRNATTPASVNRMWSRIEARGRAGPRPVRPRRAWLLIAAAAVATPVAFAGVTMAWRAVPRTEDAATQGGRSNGAEARIAEGEAKPGVPARAPAAPPVIPLPAAEAARAPESRAAFEAASSPPAVSSGQTSGESWRQLAARGENAKAYAELGRAGLASESRSATVADLFALADVARLSGHPAEAREPLERIFNEHPSDGRAALAALTLGRIELRSLAAPAAAAAALEKALALGLPAALGEDAYRLLVESRATAGDRAGARAAYGEYMARFPESARGAEGTNLRRWVADP